MQIFTEKENAAMAKSATKPFQERAIHITICMHISTTALICKSDYLRTALSVKKKQYNSIAEDSENSGLHFQLLRFFFSTPGSGREFDALFPFFALSLFSINALA